jgi:phosphonate transport system ATP-binding protein
MILADEPIASLDPLNAQIVMECAARTSTRNEGITVITNLHTLDTARAYCERVIGMAGGKVVFDGPADELTTGAVRMIYGAIG